MMQMDFFNFGTDSGSRPHFRSEKSEIEEIPSLS